MWYYLVKPPPEFCRCQVIAHTNIFIVFDKLKIPTDKEKNYIYIFKICSETFHVKLAHNKTVLTTDYVFAVVKMDVCNKN